MVHSRTGRLWQRRRRLACLLCVWMALALGIAPVFAQEPDAEQPTARQKELLEQQNQYGQQVQQLRKEGKLAEAIEAAEEMLAIERELFGDVHAEVAGTLGILAKMHLQKDDFAAVEKTRREALAIHEKLFGAEHWRTTDARLALEGVKQLAALTPEERQQLTEASRLHAQVIQLYQQGRYAEAIPLARKVTEVREDLLGEEHPSYATSLNNLALLYGAMGDHARAEPLLRQALEITQVHVDLCSWVQSERQQLVMSKSLRYYLDAYLSLTTRLERSREATYQHVLVWKGSVLARQRWLRLSQDSSEVRAEQARSKVTPADVQKALPADAALVDVLEYMHLSPPPEGKGRMDQELRLVAFVARPDRPIARIELGPVTAVAQAIDAWRQTIAPGSRVASRGPGVRRPGPTSRRATGTTAC